MIMFEIGGEYTNRRGKYTVVAIREPKMTVRYDDGTEATLNMGIQARIWENIIAEEEAKASRSRSKRKAGKDVRHYIKAVSIPSEDLLAFPGWQERVVMAPKLENARTIKASDRFIYYAVEARVFFAVLTITGDVFLADPKNYFFNLEVPKTSFFPVDTDVAVSGLAKGVSDDSMELESQPKFRHLRIEPESFLPINEDDFELLAEAIAEASEEDDEDGGSSNDDDFLEED